MLLALFLHFAVLHFYFLLPSRLSCYATSQASHSTPWNFLLMRLLQRWLTTFPQPRTNQQRHLHNPPHLWAWHIVSPSLAIFPAQGTQAISVFIPHGAHWLIISILYWKTRTITATQTKATVKLIMKLGIWGIYKSGILPLQLECYINVAPARTPSSPMCHGYLLCKNYSTYISWKKLHFPSLPSRVCGSSIASIGLRLSCRPLFGVLLPPCSS